MDKLTENANSNQEYTNGTEPINGFKDTSHSEASLTEATIADDQVNNPPDAKFKEKENESNTKEEKQRLNEEIIIFETSSLSSEAGSWEPVFPVGDRVVETASSLVSQEGDILKDGCDKNVIIKITTQPCFIDAATLVDEVITTDKVIPPTNLPDLSVKPEEMYPALFEITPLTDDSLSLAGDVPPKNKNVEKKQDMSHIDLIEINPITKLLQADIQSPGVSIEEINLSTNSIIVPPNTSSTSVIRHVFTNFCETPDNSITTGAGEQLKHGYKEIVLPLSGDPDHASLGSEKPIPKSTYSTSWVIDMSKDDSLLAEETSTENVKKNPQSKKASCFFVNLNEGEESSKEDVTKKLIKKKQNAKDKDIKSKSVNIPLNSETRAIFRLFPDIDKKLIMSTPAYLNKNSEMQSHSTQITSSAMKHSQKHCHSGRFQLFIIKLLFNMKCLSSIFIPIFFIILIHLLTFRLGYIRKLSI